MLERASELPQGVEGLRAHGTVTREDYEQVVQPLLEQLHGEGRRTRMLYEFAEDFSGFSLGGIWEDARLCLHYLRLFERCAVVSDVGWIRVSARVAGAMLPCAVRVFGSAEREQAVQWLAARSDATALSHRLLETQRVLVLEPDRSLRPEDFDAVARTVDPWIERHGPLHGVVVHTREFPGWESLGSFVRHVQFVLDHHRKVARVALAADGRLAALVPRLAEHFVAAQVKHFDYEEFDDAIAWAAESSAP